MNKGNYEIFKGGLTEAEWQEAVVLDYVLTWRYTDNYARDLFRYKELSAKRGIKGENNYFVDSIGDTLNNRGVEWK